MGRSIARSSKRSLHKVAVQSETSQVAYSSADYLERAHQFLANFNLDLAFESCKRSLVNDEQNAAGLELLAIIELEMGRVDDAKNTLIKAIAVPSPPASAFLCLAQLCKPEEALAYFASALAILRKDLEDGTGLEQQVRRSASRALVGMTEVYLTDLCFEDDAEQKCENYLQEAVAVDPSDPEVYTTLASVRLSQQREKDAIDSLQRSWALWKDLEPDDELVPPYESRVALAKLFIETSQLQTALTILLALQEQDDEHIQAQYLLGLAWYMLGQQPRVDTTDLETPEECAIEARNYFVKCLQLEERLEDKEEGDDELAGQVQEMLDALYAAGVPKFDPEQHEAALGADDWEDLDEDEDDDADAMQE